MLIVGAGISGLALARALRQFDIETRILDKRNQHAEAGWPSIYRAMPFRHWNVSA
ncbi:FAD/NAD(P)-binding protein [Brucella sp. 10RB9215]|uniref:NAD(P)-binding protein n=1 Tax=Brucella sp. 10RB9215 TaxID=1149953 RepID=UPI00155A243D